MCLDFDGERAQIGLVYIEEVSCITLNKNSLVI